MFAVLAIAASCCAALAADLSAFYGLVRWIGCHAPHSVCHAFANLASLGSSSSAAAASDADQCGLQQSHHSPPSGGGRGNASPQTCYETAIHEKNPDPRAGRSRIASRQTCYELAIHERAPDSRAGQTPCLGHLRHSWRGISYTHR